MTAAARLRDPPWPRPKRTKISAFGAQSAPAPCGQPRTARSLESTLPGRGRTACGARHPRGPPKAPPPTTSPPPPPPPGPIPPVEDIVAEVRAGRIVILVDEEDRENEGDLVLAADHVTPEAISFMARFGRGLICPTLSRERC